MSFTQFTPPSAATGNIAVLADRPTLSAADLKARFDKGGNELLTDMQGLVESLNGLLAELAADTAAAGIGAAALFDADASPANLQAKLARLKTYIDDKAIASGAGDMQKSVYDADDDGVVDDAEKLGGQPPAYYAAASAAVPLTRTVNGKPLSADVALTAEDVGAADALAVVADTASTAKTISELADNTEYRFGTLTALTVSALATGYYIASIKFTAGTSITCSFPSGLKWNSGSAPTFTAGKQYEISISDGCACVGEF